jgi:hypothetical protein
MLKKVSIVLSVVAATFAAGATMVGTAQAAQVGQTGQLGIAASGLNLLEKSQFFFGGREYCWYEDGWNGPGWYRCGRYLIPGFGWGGGWGWHNWHHRGWHRGGPGHRGRPVHRGGRRGGGGAMGGGRRGGGGPMGGGGRRGGGGAMGGGGSMGGGGMGGGGMGMVSDIRAKHDIVLLGHLDNGLGFYRFSYNGSDKAYVGVMAQEVQAVRPDAVVRGSDGYLRVYYDRIGVHMQTWEDWVSSGAKIPATATSLRQ